MQQQRARRVTRGLPDMRLPVVGHGVGGCFRLALGGVIIGCDPKRLDTRRPAILLHHMCQFVRQQAISRCGLRGVFTCGKHHIVPHRVCQRIDRSRRLSRLPAGVHAHPAEIVAEARLHERACGRIERLAGRAQHFVHDVRHTGWFALAIWAGAAAASRGTQRTRRPRPASRHRRTCV